MKSNDKECVVAEEILSADGTKVPYTVYGLNDSKASVIILPAMGVRASFYRTFAHSLIDFDLTSCVMEYRGLGDSSLRAGWRTDFGYRQHQEDVAALIIKMKQEYPDRPIYIAGHSFGGHLGMMTAGLEPTSFDGIIMLASGTPWHEAFEGKAAKHLKRFGWFVPVIMALYGHFPGHKFGFAGRESRSQMRDWLQMSTRNRFKIIGVRDDLEACIAGYEGRVLCMSFARDIMAPLKASQLMLAKMPKASIDLQIVGDEDINGEATHFGWAKTPQVVAQYVSEWVR